MYFQLCIVFHLSINNDHLRGFVKLKKNPKIREKIRKWVGVSKAKSDFYFFFKLDRGVGGWSLNNPSFSRIFGIF